MNHFIIDFDSTFIKDESLDVLAKFSFGKEDKFVDKIANITNDGMEGKISFKESLTRRIELFDSNKKCLEMTIEFLKNRVSKSFKENKQFLKKNSDNIYILSSGFLDIIEPIVMDFNIKKENIFGNNFTFDEFDNITGFEKTNTLSSDLGKVHIVKNLNLKVGGFSNQGTFLKNLGILQRGEIISKNLPFSKKADIFYRINRLINKNQMGELFKVLFITSKKNNFKGGFY